MQLGWTNVFCFVYLFSFCLRTLLDVVCRLTSGHKIKILMQVLAVGRKIGANVEYIGLLP